jgi:hypothetical protein
MEIEFHVDARGPLFDGRAQAAVSAYARHIENFLADRAVTDIRNYLPTQYMYLGHHGGTPQFNPVPPDAGFLQAQIHTERASEDSVLVTDDPVIYGPWIEGVAPGNEIIWPHRRNPPPRRFPGYHTFRKIAQKLNAEAEEIAQRELQPFLEEMR